MLDDASMIRHTLRSRRTLSDGTKLSVSSSRRRAFSAAMQQFEEQLDSAKVVTPLTRPINLYYGLVQAGLAIQAAYAPDPWSFSRHGLTPVDFRPKLPDIQVKPSGTGAFQAVSKTVQSQAISSPVTVATIWASIPELGGEENNLEDSSPPALPLSYELSTSTWGPPADQIYPGPKADLYIPRDVFAREREAGTLDDFLRHYPGLDGATIVGDLAEVEIGLARAQVVLEWPNPAPAQEMTQESIIAFFDERAPNYRYRTNRYARPSISPDFCPTPLMSWWLLLYLFSMLARYQPREWLDILDLDKSKSAALVGYALDVAMIAIPQLVLEALDRRPVLLSKPVYFWME